MVLSEYWKLVAEEEEEKKRAKKEFHSAGLHRSGLTDEEREMLENDPELTSYVKTIEAQRAEDARKEKESKDEADRMDRQIVAPIEEAQAKARLWDEWEAGWTMLVQIEEMTAARFDAFLDDCWDIEEKELKKRSVVERERIRELKELYTLERQKHRYLVECQAWVEDWETSYQQRWDEGRKARDERLLELIELRAARAAEERAAKEDEQEGEA